MCARRCCFRRQDDFIIIRSYTGGVLISEDNKDIKQNKARGLT